MDQITQDLINHFQIRQITGQVEYQIPCPFHGDLHPSASINIQKRLFNCFAGCGGRNFEQLHKEVGLNGDRNSINNNLNTTINTDFSSILNTEQNQEKPVSNTNFLLDLSAILSQGIGQSVQIVKDISDDEIRNFLITLITSKGISPEILSSIRAEPILAKTSPLFGHIKFPTFNDNFVARKFLPDEIISGPKYRNSADHEQPIFGDLETEFDDYILVEGIFDYLSLLEMGYKNVICNCGTAFAEKRAYFFKNKVVFILFDNDYAGFMGAEKARQTLRNIRANPIVLDLPKPFGKDVNEAFKNDRIEFEKWLTSNCRIYEGDDTAYISQFDKQENLFTLRTGIPEWDKTLGGGLKVGIHGIVAKPTVGKSALALYTAKNLCDYNPYVTGLYVTYEIPKSQCWARLASMEKGEREWNEIEKDNILLPNTKKEMQRLAQKLRIVAMWDIHQIIRAMKNYRFLVIDYIQLMPGDSDERHNVNTNMRLLSKLWMDSKAAGDEKIIIIVSTIPRTSYEKEDLSVFKESGNIEYAIQSGFLLRDISTGINPRMIKVITLKNTRGIVGNSFWLEGDMAHNTFKEVTPEF